MKNIDLKYGLALLGFTCGLFALSSLALYQSISDTPEEPKIEEYTPKSEYYEDVVDTMGKVHEIGKRDISIDNIYSLFEYLNIEHSDIVFAQMKLESGNFNSNLAKNNNNFFGMKYPRQRATVAQGADRGYAYYRSWSYSVLDYAMWQRRYASGLTEDEYLEMLLEKYAEDKSYVKKVKSIADSIKLK